ncbi:MAG: hypothetical protein V4677_14840 [Bacteroidota bacterium]
MSRSAENYKENIIEYIITNNPKIKRTGLEEMDIESLVLIKLQIEFELARKNNKSKK